MQDGTTGEVFREAVCIKFHPDFDHVFSHERHVVVNDVMMTAVGGSDSKGLERFGVKLFTDLHRGDHGRNM